MSKLNAHIEDQNYWKLIEAIIHYNEMIGPLPKSGETPFTNRQKYVREWHLMILNKNTSIIDRYHLDEEERIFVDLLEEFIFKSHRIGFEEAILDNIEMFSDLLILFLYLELKEYTKEWKIKYK